MEDDGEIVVVVGAGYVGLTTALGLGRKVYVYDVDEVKVDRLNRGIMPFNEPGMDDALRVALEEGRVEFVSTSPMVFHKAFVCVPSDQVVGRLERWSGDGTIVVRSTLSLTDAEKIAEKWPDAIMWPEFLKEGTALADFYTERTVLGGDPDQCKRLHEWLNIGAAWHMGFMEAALVKLASNSYLAMKLSFANGLARTCDAYELDVTKVLQGVGGDKRIGGGYMRPGPGYGGSCLPKDLRLLREECLVPSFKYMLQAVEDVNTWQTIHVQMEAAEAGVIAVWGQAFKGGVDDVRNSPGYQIAKTLSEGKWNRVVATYDPLCRGVNPCETAFEACHGADVLIVATDWSGWIWQDPHEIGPIMGTRRVVDACNILDAGRWKEAGFDYVGMGRR